MTRYTCPHCEESNLDVQITTWARLDQDDPENLQTHTGEAQFNDHDWDSDSLMQCRDCGYVAKSCEFPQIEVADLNAAIHEDRFRDRADDEEGTL